MFRYPDEKVKIHFRDTSYTGGDIGSCMKEDVESP